MRDELFETDTSFVLNLKFSIPSLIYDLGFFSRYRFGIIIIFGSLTIFARRKFELDSVY